MLSFEFSTAKSCYLPPAPDYNGLVRAARQQILGVLLIALLIFIFVVARFGRFFHWNLR